MSSARLRLPPFRSLLAFHAAATHDRLSDAAASLGITESAVSHQIRQLEQLVHAPLFDRTRSRLSLNEAGRRYLASIEPALREIQAATEAMLPVEGRVAVRLSLPPSLAATWLIPRLERFEGANPGIEIQLVATTRVLNLSREQIDVAIRYGKGDWPNVEARLLIVDRATPVAAPAYVDAAAADAATLLAGRRVIVNRSIPGEWDEWCRARGLEPPRLQDALVFDSIEQVLQVAEAGHGVAMGRSPYVDPLLQSGALVAPFGTVNPTGAAYYLCRPAGTPPSAAARKLARWLEDEARAFEREAAGDGPDRVADGGTPGPVPALKTP